jgi:hypothetical protein
MLSRFVRLLVVVISALALAALLNLGLVLPSVTRPLSAVGPAQTSTVEPTEWFSATALLTGSAGSVIVGDPVTVTAQLVTTGTCGFALFAATLKQSDPLFTYVDPAANVVGPPGPNPAVWRLAARQTGVTTFTVDFDGETHCNGAWIWKTIRGQSQPITVTGAAHFLPFAPRYVPPARRTDLGTRGGTFSTAWAINDRNQVADNSTVSADDRGPEVAQSSQRRSEEPLSLLCELCVISARLW